jgi:filamentous hemagglutinin family protein
MWSSVNDSGSEKDRPCSGRQGRRRAVHGLGAHPVRRPCLTPFPFVKSTLWSLGWLIVATAAGIYRAAANPQGLTVSQGSATATQNGSRVDVTASQNAVLDWQKFNIAPGEVTTFHQPSPISVVWNRVLDPNPSHLLGTLNANGIVVLMNQNGFYFGPNSVVNVGGLVVTTVPATGPMPAAGGIWQFEGLPPAARIVNYGEIKAHTGGSLFLISEQVENQGTLSAPQGSIGLLAGQTVLLTDRPDGRGLSVSVQLPTGSVDNSGKLVADAGTVALHAKVVNQNGVIQANTVRNQNGVIELVASDNVQLGPNSTLRASADSSQDDHGGQITIKSANRFTDNPSSVLDVRGGVQGGDGGSVELSAINMPQIQSHLDASAQPGWRSGTLLLDPYDIFLTASNGNATSPAQVNSDDPPSVGTLTLNVNRAFAGFSEVHLQASHDISLDRMTVWDLNASTGVSAPGSKLTLEAGSDIIFGDGSRIQTGAGWSVNLRAGVDFASPTQDVLSGTGGVYLNGGPAGTTGANPIGSGAIETADGNIDIEAGHEVLVGSGYVRTANGGSISITTKDGDVSSGTLKDTYVYSNKGYKVAPTGMGGIGTENGGDVTIQAGRDVLSFNATIGALGAAPGNVTLTAAEDVKGGMMVRNGIGTIQAGRDVGAPLSPVSLALVTGGWNVNATRDLYLNEVYNPSGSLNQNRMLFGAKTTFQFDYAPNAFANLSAGDSVQLLGNNPARTQDNPDRTPIYPPQLSVTAGAGGVLLGNDVTLYPSPQGSLNIQTAGGGGLRSTPDGFYQLVMSDSDSPDYRTFASGHAATPLHLGDQGAGFQLNISGSVQNLLLRSPRQADVQIQGNALNFSFDGQNLSPDDVTQLHIGGNYSSRSDRTSITLSAPPNLAVLTDPVFSTNPDLGARLSYDSTTRQLTVQGILTPAELDILLHPTVYVLDPLTQMLAIDTKGNPITVPAVFSTDTAALNQLFSATQDIPRSPLARNGIQLGGPGRLDLSANNMDLGVSAGIRSIGPLENAALADLSLQGADVTLHLSGNLAMTSSQIASFNGGSIAIASGGSLDIGSQNSFGSDDTPRGIYTGHGGSVSVEASGDILVSGSRIATYDGDDVTVTSDHGTVDAGAGAKGFFTVTTGQIDPSTGAFETRNDRFFGSGIMALTRVDSQTRVGNITITAANDISANAGGVLQLAFNQYDQSGAKVELDAGGSIRANQSGILGSSVSLTAKGSIEGVVVANRDVVIDARQSVSVTAVAGGSATVSSGGAVSGSIVGGGGVNVAGSEVSAALISTKGSVSASGDASGSRVGAFTSVTAPTVQRVSDSADKTVAADNSTQLQDDEKKKRLAQNKPVLVRRVGRVTVILPASSR